MSDYRDRGKGRKHRSGANYVFNPNEQMIGSTKKTNRNSRENLLYPNLDERHRFSFDGDQDIHQSIDDFNQSEDDHEEDEDEPTVNRSRDSSPFKKDHIKIQNKLKESSHWFHSTKGLLVFILSLIALCISYLVFDGNRYFRFSANEVPFNRLSEWTLFESEFNRIESKFEKVLPNYGFKVMKTAVKSVMNKTSLSSGPEPAVILLIGSKEQTQVMKCIQNDFVNAINRAYNENNSIKINGKQTNTNDIIEKFEQTFGSKQRHTIIVENIESISTDHIMALHQFTDHENAKFPDSIIILTAINHQKINLNKRAGLRDMDEIASQLFEMKWKNTMAEDQRSALISRFTPSVVTILEDKNNEIKC